MTLLHEIIAAESDLKNHSREIITETIKTFSGRTELFNGRKRVLTMFDEKREAEGDITNDPVSTTVGEKLDYMWNVVGRAMDVTSTKENTNSQARADVVVDDEIIIKSVPVTVLLALETALNRLHDVYLTIPTLSPTLSWSKDDSFEKDIRKSNELKTLRTEKIVEPKVLYEATKEHPAQVKEYSIDRAIGAIMTTNYSGMITPGEKSRMLGRISDLSIAVKEARQRANTVHMEPLEVADAVKGFIHS